MLVYKDYIGYMTENADGSYAGFLMHVLGLTHLKIVV